jgi:hypothetical protein
MAIPSGNAGGQTPRTAERYRAASGPNFYRGGDNAMANDAGGKGPRASGGYTDTTDGPNRESMTDLRVHGGPDLHNQGPAGTATARAHGGLSRENKGPGVSPGKYPNDHDQRGGDTTLLGRAGHAGQPVTNPADSRNAALKKIAKGICLAGTEEAHGTQHRDVVGGTESNAQRGGQGLRGPLDEEPRCSANRGGAGPALGYTTPYNRQNFTPAPDPVPTKPGG